MVLLGMEIKLLEKFTAIGAVASYPVLVLAVYGRRHFLMCITISRM